MQCPKCQKAMEEIQLGNVTIDQCSACKGLWFDRGEAEALSENWIAEFVDTGDPEVGGRMDEVDTVNCPRCSKTMRRFFDIATTKLKHEECDEHGKFYDAGEFTVWVEGQYL